MISPVPRQLPAADANPGVFQAVAARKLDRFGRSLRRLVNALAEFGRALIAERVRAGLAVAAARIAEPRVQGRSWRAIAAEMKLGVGAIHRIARRSKNLSAPAPV